MLILANVLTLACLVLVADAPATAEAPPPTVSKSADGDPKPQEAWHLTLAEAIRIGLENSEVVRVVTPGARAAVGPEPAPADAAVGREANRAGIVIARLNADASVWDFKAAIMAHVRSIEQQYWALSQQQVALWARETAVRLGEEILFREKGELAQGRATTADVAEAAQQLENFKLNLVTATSDAITTERQLRNILGLPVADGRRIVPDTEPTEARLQPDWEACLREMHASQPDIVQQDLLVRLSELRLLLARNQPLPPMDLNAVARLQGLGQSLEPAPFNAMLPNLPALAGKAEARMHAAALDAAMPECLDFTHQQLGLTLPPTGMGGRVPLANTRQAQYQLLRQRDFLRQIVHQTTHSLARFFLEVDANYKQFRTAQGLRAAAQQRLEAQRAFYEEGRVTIDRLLDAVSQHANAIAQEAQYKTSYNTSIAALEEAKGTLLTYDGITVLDGPGHRDYIAKAAKRQDDRVVTAAFEQPPTAPAAAPRPRPTTYKLRAKLGGLQVLEVEVEVNEAPTPGPDGR